MVLVYGSDTLEDFYEYLHSSSKQMRLLLKENYLWICRQLKFPLDYLIRSSNCKIGIKDIQFLKKILNEVKINLLYRGSTDGWKCKDFH